jgi:citronellyl-CoA synthetase
MGIPEPRLAPLKDVSAEQYRERIGFLEFIVKFLPFMARIPYIAYHGLKGLRMISGKRNISWGLILEEAARKYGDRMAVKSSEGNLTYRELNEGANRFAHFLILKNVEKGDTVTACMSTRPALLLLFCGCAKIGAVCSLINVSQRGASLAHSFNLNKGKVIVVGEECYDDVKAAAEDIDSEGAYLCTIRDPLRNAMRDEKDITDRLAQMPSTNLPETRQLTVEDRLAYVYTSGTSGGMPKAAVVTNQRVLSAMFWFGRIVTPMKPEHTIYLPLPFFHANAIITGWPPAFYSGAAVAIRRKFSASEFNDDVKRFHATHFVYVGEVCRYLMAQPEVPGQNCTSLKYVVGNGLRPDIWRRFKDRYGLKKVLEFYGAAEGVGVFTNLLDFDYAVGMSFTPYALVKYDVENARPLRDEKRFLIKAQSGQAGLLIMKIGAKTPFPGYSDKTKNEEKILRNAFRKGDMWFNTGDVMRSLGYRQAQFVDRLGDTFRWKSENVATMEVEKALLTLPGVGAAAVYGVRMPTGEGKAGMAAIIKDNQTDIDLSALSSHLKAALPRYAVPLFIRYVRDFQWTATHKVKKHDLKREGFDPSKVTGHLFVLLPGTERYVPLTDKIYQGIMDGKFMF